MGISTTEIGTVTAFGRDFIFRECGDCGVAWALTESFLDNRRKDHRTWYCPNGHPWQYSGKNEEEKLRAALKTERERSARLTSESDQLAASLRTTKGHVTRLRKRAAAGVYPCCETTFPDLAQHMESEHPDFAA